MAIPAADINCWPGPSSRGRRARRRRLAVLLVAGLWSLTMAPAAAGVVFDNCQPTPDGGVSCDTRPTGNTLDDDEAARYGLLDEASPGWAEFDPYEGYDDMFGGNWT